MMPMKNQHISNRNQKISVHAIVCLLILMLSACSSTADKLDTLDRTLRGYEKALRWANYEAAYSFHKWDSDEQPSIPAHLQSIRLTNYSVSNQNFDEDTMTAKQTVKMRFYNQNDLRERSLVDNQEWKYFPDKKRWYLMTKPPTFH